MERRNNGKNSTRAGGERKLLTLCIIHRQDNVLLGMKKRGIGEGKWNGFGGKVETGETIEAAALREVSEEAGITVSSIKNLGILDFTLPGEVLTWQVHIFKATDFKGDPIETDEMKPQWFAVNDIPYDAMWADDIHWLPLFLEGKSFTGTFIFDNEWKLAEHNVEETTPWIPGQARNDNL